MSGDIIHKSIKCLITMSCLHFDEAVTGQLALRMSEGSWHVTPSRVFQVLQVLLEWGAQLMSGVCAFPGCLWQWVLEFLSRKLGGPATVLIAPQLRLSHFCILTMQILKFAGYDMLSYVKMLLFVVLEYLSGRYCHYAIIRSTKVAATPAVAHLPAWPPPPKLLRHLTMDGPPFDLIHSNFHL